MDEWDEEERKDDDDEREDDLTVEERNKELERYLTEYEPNDEEGVVESVAEIMTARVQFAIMDQIEHMIYAADFGNPNEIKKIILRDVQLYIDGYREPEDLSKTNFYAEKYTMDKDGWKIRCKNCGVEWGSANPVVHECKQKDIDYWRESDGGLK